MNAARAASKEEGVEPTSPRLYSLPLMIRGAGMDLKSIKSGLLVGRLPAAFTVFVTIAAAAIFLWLAQFDAFYRTIFIEEFHSGEAGRAAYLFGSFLGEGGGYQSKVAAPAASILSWMSFEAFGLGRFQLRLPFVLLSVASVAAFGVFVRREAGEHRLLAGAALLAFVLSPFLINLRATSTNETLFVPVLALTLALAGSFESATAPRSRLLLAFALAFCSGLAVFVKFDGAIIPAAVLLVFLSGLWSRSVSIRELAAFVAGGAAVLCAYIATQLWASGAEGLQASLAWGAGALKNVTYLPKSPFEQFTRTIITAPKNFNLLFPGMSLTVLAVIALGIFLWRFLSLAGKINATIAIAFFVAAPFLPLVYWKRVLFAAPAVFALAISACAAWERMPPSELRRAQIIGRLLLPLSVAIGMFAIVSPFQGMWRVVPLGVLGAREILLLLLALALASLPVAFKLDGARLRGIVIAMSAATIAFGALELSVRRDREAALIGREVGRLIDGSSVVADHNAFRIAGYFSNARFSFVHENDAGFPNLIAERAQSLRPDFVVVTDSYRKLGALVGSRLPGYEIVLERRFSNPPSYFRRAKTKHVIRVFRRASSAVSNGSESVDFYAHDAAKAPFYSGANVPLLPVSGASGA